MNFHRQKKRQIIFKQVIVFLSDEHELMGCCDRLLQEQRQLCTEASGTTLFSYRFRSIIKLSTQHESITRIRKLTVVLILNINRTCLKCKKANILYSYSLQATCYCSEATFPCSMATKTKATTQSTEKFVRHVDRKRKRRRKRNCNDNDVTTRNYCRQKGSCRSSTIDFDLNNNDDDLRSSRSGEAGFEDGSKFCICILAQSLEVGRGFGSLF